MLKSAIGRKLDDANLKSAVTPSGIPTWRTQVRKSASASGIDDVCETYGISDERRAQLYACADKLDIKKLQALGREVGNDAMLQAILDLIEEKVVSFVLLQPLRRSAPKLEEVQVPA